MIKQVFMKMPDSLEELNNRVGSILEFYLTYGFSCQKELGRFKRNDDVYKHLYTKVYTKLLGMSCLQSKQLLVLMEKEFALLEPSEDDEPQEYA